MIADVQPALLAALHPTGFLDLRAFFADKRSQDAANISYPAENLQAAVNFVNRWQDRDIYMGVATRIDAQSRDLSGCAALYALFADLDFKDSSEEATRARLAAFALPPSAVVSSGGGLQVYWFLTEHLDLQQDDTTIVFAKSLLLSLALALGGDRKSAEPARILRVPGSLNYKYDPPRRVFVEAFDETIRYTVADFLTILPIVAEEKAPEDPIRHGLTREVRMRIAIRWLEGQDPAIEHQGGDNHTYMVCCAVAHGHDLSPDDTLTVLQHWNKRCQPPWPEVILKQKIRTASKSANGPKGERLRLIVEADNPMKMAREFVARKYFCSDTLSLRHQASVFYMYDEDLGAYTDRDEAAVRAELYTFLEAGFQWRPVRNADPQLIPFKPNKSKVENVLDALRAVSNLPLSVAAPAWLNREYLDFNAKDMLACPNGLLHIPTRTFHMKTPHLYTVNGIDFAYDPYAPVPEQWMAFLDSLWHDDQESIDCLQEILGYFLAADTKLQKIIMLIGDKRSGKGIIGRITGRLVGKRNTCSPTLSSFGQQFGKQALIGKTLAIVSDARLSGQTDTAMVAETLLSISGEDHQSIPRKFLTDWHGPMPTRFMLLTNELPRIIDVSGALNSRFIILRLTESFLGREDLGLFERLEPELPSILQWALVGLDRLSTRGYLLQPGSAQEMVAEFGDLGSPESAFLREMTIRKAGTNVSQEDLFTAWQTWCRVNGREHSGTAQTFGRNIRATLPWVTSRRHGTGSDQKRHWEGLGLLDTAQR